jgi:hypothetical protein
MSHGKNDPFYAKALELLLLVNFYKEIERITHLTCLSPR